MWLVAGVAACLAAFVVVLAALVEPDGRTTPSRVGPVSPQDLRTARFPLVWRGYDPAHVDAVLARAATALEEAARYGAATPSDRGELPAFITDTFETPVVRADEGIAAGEDDRPDPGP